MTPPPTRKWCTSSPLCGNGWPSPAPVNGRHAVCLRRSRRSYPNRRSGGGQRDAPPPLEADAEREQEVDVLHVAIVLLLEEVRPGVVPLRPEAVQEGAAAAGALQVGVEGGVDCTDDVGLVLDLVELDLGRAVAPARVDADPAPRLAADGGRQPQV